MQRIILLLGLLLFTATITQAQERRNEGGDRWWFGSHIDLGFTSNTFRSSFTFGLAPMAGYKLSKDFSVGPRASVLLKNYRAFDGFGGVEGTTVFDYGLAAFLRGHIYRGFFAQAEFGYENIGYIYTDLSVERVSGANGYIGAGYNSTGGGRVGYEIMLAYDLNMLAQPKLNLLSYRIGFTYNFLY